MKLTKRMNELLNSGITLTDKETAEVEEPAAETSPEAAAPEEPVAVVDLINDEFPEAQKELEETMGAIVQSIKDGDIEKLIAFHAYSPKFTEFKGGAARVGAAENEEFERNTFGAVTEVVKIRQLR